jgi:hypothetical protein
MGGNIFKYTRRYEADEYRKLEAEVLYMLEDVNERIFTLAGMAGNERHELMQPIKYYSEKESFGDMDIIINSKHLQPNYIKGLIEIFELNSKSDNDTIKNIAEGNWSKNGNVFSFKYKEFQIDLIITADEDFQPSIDYFGYNDLGNLVGRVTHKLGLKVGHRGTHVIVRDDSHLVGEILVTKDLREILELADFDVAKWEAGFNTLEEIYIWVSNSKYFNKEIYSLDNRNHYSRTRDAKRATYKGFTEWCETREFENNFPYSEMTSKDGYNIREPFFTELICKRFPHVKEEYDVLIAEYEEHKIFKSKFNGDICMKITGLEGKALGEFMAYAKRYTDRDNIKHMFMKYSEHTCGLMLASMYHHYKMGYEWLEMPMNLKIQISRNEGLVR